MKRKRTIVALSLLLVAGLSTGCNRPKDKVLPDGTKVFGERTLKDGTKKRVRVELPDGKKKFDVTLLADGTEKAGRVEYPDGHSAFDLTWLPDVAVKIGRIEFRDGEKDFEVTVLPDGTEEAGHTEYSNGVKDFDRTTLPDGTVKSGRIERPDGGKIFDYTKLPDGTVKAGRMELPDGEKDFSATTLPDGTLKIGRREFPDGQKSFNVTKLPDGTVTTGRVESQSNPIEYAETAQSNDGAPVILAAVKAQREGDGLIAVVMPDSTDEKVERQLLFHPTITLSCAATTAKYCDTPLKLDRKYAGHIYAVGGSLVRWDIYEGSDGNHLAGRYFLHDSELANELSPPIEILSVNREHPNPMSSAFLPVLMIRNNSAENREIHISWYAIDGGVTVEQGSCYTVGPLLAKSTTRVTCSSLVLGHPNAAIRLGAIEQRVTN